MANANPTESENMKSFCSHVSLVAGFLSLLLATSIHAQTLIHRYSFNDVNGIPSDSVGGATWNGTLQGTASLDGSMLQLDGGGFVTLPAGLITNYTQVSV